GSSTPRAWRIRATTRVAASEWPPREKKLSRIPTFSTRSTCDQIPARISSVGFRGARYPADARGCKALCLSMAMAIVAGSDRSLAMLAIMAVSALLADEVGVSGTACDVVTSVFHTD